MEKGKKFVVACGGTGGHLFPGLAVAHALQVRGHQVVVWVTGRTIEQAGLKSWSGNVFSTSARPLALKNIFSLLYSFLRCWREMRRFAPDAILAMGSYASLPPVLAARLCEVPVVLHEANAIPGQATTFLAHFACVTAISFAACADYMRNHATCLTGLPVRTDLADQPRFPEVNEQAFCLFVTGGSQGAHRVNELVVQALECVQNTCQKQASACALYVIHQTGKADESWVRAKYEAAQISARVNAFEQEMGRAFATADLVVCRAGASTCFELATVGKSAFFIPLPTAKRNHQHLNALDFVKKGAADEGFQDELTPRALAHFILHKMEHPEDLATKAHAMKELAVCDAAVRVADLLEKNAR